MAVGPTASASASVVDFRNLSQIQGAGAQPIAGQQAPSESSLDTGTVDTGRLDTAATDETGTVETPKSHGENANPGAAGETRDDRLPGSGSATRGTRLDIAV